MLKFTLSISLTVFLISFSFGTSDAFAATATDSLVGYWKFDETSVGSTVADSSGDSNNGTPTGDPSPTTEVPTTSFSNTRSLSFDGSTQYISKTGPTGFNRGTDPRTIAGWVYVTDTADVKVPFAYGLCGASNGGKAFGVYLDAAETINFWGCGSSDFSTGVTVTPGAWTHLAVTYDGTNVRVYKNGTQAGPTTARSLINIADANSVVWQVGAASLLDSGNYYYTGNIDEVRVYNRALSSTEITAIASGNHTSMTWDGSSSTDTETAANWDTGVLPDPYTNITIADTANDPVLTANFQSASTTIESGASFDLAGFDWTMNDSGVFLNSGSLLLDGDETITEVAMDADSGTTTYNGSGTYVSGLTAGDNYYNLEFNGSGSWTLDAALDVNNDLTITSGTLDSGGNTITLGRHWSNSGTYTHGNNSVTLDGTNQTVSGSTTFYNLTKSVSSAATLTFEAAATQTILNTLTLNGALSNLLSLRSSIADTAWKLDPQGTRTISYLDVKDSNNVNVTEIDTENLNITNSGGNTNWRFDYTAPTITILGDNPTTVAFGATYSDDGATATDETDGNISGSISTSNSVDTSTPGTYTVTYTVLDSAGNSTSATRSVTVSPPIGGTAPWCSGPSAPGWNISLLGGGCTATVSFSISDTEHTPNSVDSHAHVSNEGMDVEVAAPLRFMRDLYVGIYGEDVKQLQRYLNNNGYVLTDSGFGSIGNETKFFGVLTRQALSEFQKNHNISPAVGYFGPITRSAIKQISINESVW